MGGEERGWEGMGGKGKGGERKGGVIKIQLRCHMPDVHVSAKSSKTCLWTSRNTQKHTCLHMYSNEGTKEGCSRVMCVLMLHRLIVVSIWK